MTDFYPRYKRQMILPELGPGGQSKLHSAAVLVVGAGGLGCPVLQYLAAAGVGRIGIVDDDVVSLHNLHRQVLYSEDEVGRSKAAVAELKLRQLNSDIVIEGHQCRASNKNIIQMIRDYDLVLDCTDNFSTRYLVSDACALSKKTLVFGAISRFEGQVAVFNRFSEGNVNPTNYRDLFPVEPSEGEIENCAEAGVIGVLPGIVGTIMAAEALKIIAGIGKALIDKLLTINILNYEQFIFDIAASTSPHSNMASTVTELEQKDYSLSCAPSTALEIDNQRFLQLIAEADTMLVDVREPGEVPGIQRFPFVPVPLSGLENNFDKFTNESIILVCQSGIRSQKAAALLAGRFGSLKKLYSLRNGVSELNQL